MDLMKKIVKYALEIYDLSHRKNFQVILMFGCQVMKVEFVSRNAVMLIETSMKIQNNLLKFKAFVLNMFRISILMKFQWNIMEIIENSIILSLEVSSSTLVSQSGTPR